MRILITGGAGFIGSTLALQLAERHPDWEITALDNLYRRGSELNLPRLRAAGVRFVHGDIRIASDLDAAGAFDTLIECSAEPSVRAGDDILVPVNLMGAHHCFKAAERHGAHIVFLSTSRVYPIRGIEDLDYADLPTRFEPVAEQSVVGAGPEGITEAFPLTGARTVYGATKLGAELLVQEYPHPWTINRFGVVAGPWQMGKVDQGVFTHWLLSGMFGKPLQYFGYDGTGRQVRDLLHVDDLVDLIDLQITGRDHWNGRIFNAGGGRANALSLQELTGVVQEITGTTLDVGARPQPVSTDVRWYVTDNSAITAFCGWTPQRSAIDTLTATHAWIREHESLVRQTLL